MAKFPNKYRSFHHLSVYLLKKLNYSWDEWRSAIMSQSKRSPGSEPKCHLERWKLFKVNCQANALSLNYYRRCIRRVRRDSGFSNNLFNSTTKRQQIIIGHNSCRHDFYRDGWTDTHFVLSQTIKAMIIVPFIKCQIIIINWKLKVRFVYFCF